MASVNDLFFVRKADKYRGMVNYSDAEYKATLQKLNSFLDASSPNLVRFLLNLWNAQGKAITYKELREAIIAGEISTEYLEQWRQDYSRFVRKYMQDGWEKAIAEGVKSQTARFPEFLFDPMSEGVRNWTQNRSAEFVTYVTDNQIEGLRAVINEAVNLEHMTPDSLARVVRPMVGLYADQTVANLKYYQKLIENGVKVERARDMSIRYGARQHRYRAMMIARQEMSMAYNSGADYGVRQAQAKGYMGETVKVWCTSMTERRCPTCKALEGAIVGMEEDFDFESKSRYRFTKRHPPAHIQCQCGVMYKEIRPPQAFYGD